MRCHFEPSDAKRLDFGKNFSSLRSSKWQRDLEMKIVEV
jgi:hypothetical protein